MVTNTELATELNEQLSRLGELWELKDAEGILNEIYTDNAEIADSDGTEIISGRQKLLDLVTGLVDSSTDASITIVKLSALAENAAYTWVNWDVGLENGDRFGMKSLFVWSKVDGNWKVVADLYAAGPFKH